MFRQKNVLADGRKVEEVIFNIKLLAFPLRTIKMSARCALVRSKEQNIQLPMFSDFFFFKF